MRYCYFTLVERSLVAGSDDDLSDRSFRSRASVSSVSWYKSSRHPTLVGKGLVLRVSILFQSMGVTTWSVASMTAIFSALSSGVVVERLGDAFVSRSHG